jgi:dTMP kinase
MIIAENGVLSDITNNPLPSWRFALYSAPMPLIVLEGPDGAGTTRHSKLLAERLIQEGHDVVLTAEPTDGPIGKQIRSMLQSNGMPDAASVQLLFCADRADHVARVIQPALDAGKIVITDRYALSTIVYGAAQGLDAEWLRKINAIFPKADITLLLLPPYEVCAERVGRRAVKDQFEVDTFQKKVYTAYQLARSSEMHVIDSSGKLEEVAEEIFNVLRNQI